MPCSVPEPAIFNALLYQKIGSAGLRDITSGNNDTGGLIHGQFPEVRAGTPAPDGEYPTAPSC
jgi:hypothetical protein